MKDEHGFTLIELMTVILIIAVLVVLALPTFLGARNAPTRATTADVRNAFAAERAYYTDTLTYTTNPATMTAIEAAITLPRRRHAAGHRRGVPASPPIPNELYISAMSESGRFYLREIDGGGAEFATDPACGVADTQVYSRNAW